MFLDQLIRTLEIEETDRPMDSRRISGPASGATTLSEVRVTASQHGKDLLELGFTVDQVVHDYGDLCQAITDLAVERDAPFLVPEFRTLNRCLDNAIADAVTEFSYQRDTMFVMEQVAESNRRLNCYSDELRKLLGTATLAFAAAKAGSLSLSGATGSILERALLSLDKLINNSLDDASLGASDSATLHQFSAARLIEEVFAPAELAARQHGCTLKMKAVDPTLGVQGYRDALLVAIVNILQNAFQYTQPNTEVLLTAYGAADRILIDVRDYRGGLLAGTEAAIPSPFAQGVAQGAGSGAGLAVALKSVTTNGGTLTARDIPGSGCVFTISLPRYTMPN